MKKTEMPSDDNLTLDEKNQEVLEEIEENNREDAIDSNSDYMEELKEESEIIGEPSEFEEKTKGK